MANCMQRASTELSEAMIYSSAESIACFIRETGESCNIISESEVREGGFIIYQPPNVFVRTGEAPYNSVIEAGDIIEAGSLGDMFLVTGKTPVEYQSETVKYKLEMLVCNILCDFQRHTEVRNTQTLLSETVWQVIRSGVYGFKANLTGADLEKFGKFGGIILEANELYVPSASEIKQGDRFQLAEWKQGTGTINATGKAVTGFGTAFTVDLYAGGKLSANNRFRIIDEILSDTHCTVTEDFTDLDQEMYGYCHLQYTGKYHMVEGIKDQKSDVRGVSVLTLAEDTR